MKELSQAEVEFGKKALSRSEEELIAIIIQGYDTEGRSGGAARATLDVLNRKKLANAAWALVIATAALVLATGVLVFATFFVAR